MAQSDIDLFTSRLAAYKKVLDADITQFAKQIDKSTLAYYGESAHLATEAFLGILTRGGKRIRGALTMLGYEMCGGKDQQMIIQAARVVEMMHAYLLIIDDIQDRSSVRRGGPTAHVSLRDYHRTHKLAADPDHFGVAIALTSALSGAHSAQMILANLDVDEDRRIKALSILNRTMLVTMHGQTNDIMNEVVPEVDEAQLERVLEWKTATYSFLNPLHMGMVLAGAGCEDTDAITPYATHIGKAFQITDDIIGVFGSEAETGKGRLDDIREGKRTLLTFFALKHAGKKDRDFLKRCLGNDDLTPADFERCKDIIDASGALSHARHRASTHIAAALKSFEHEQARWPVKDIVFLRGLAETLLDRNQ